MKNVNELNKNSRMSNRTLCQEELSQVSGGRLSPNVYKWIPGFKKSVMVNYEEGTDLYDMIYKLYSDDLDRALESLSKEDEMYGLEDVKQYLIEHESFWGEVVKEYN